MTADRHRFGWPLALAALLAGCATAGCTTAGPGPGVGASGAATPSSAPPATSAPAPSASGAPTTIPVSAFFALPEGMRFGEIRRPAEVENALPRLCGGEFASGGATAAGAAVTSVYGLADAEPGSIPHGVVYQTIRTYPGDGASAFMTGLRDDLRACTAFRVDGTPFRTRVADLAGVGDEALTIDLVQPQTDLPGNPTGGDQVNRVVVIRVGDVVTVVRDAEYERSSSVPEVVADFARLAVAAIGAWRG